MPVNPIAALRRGRAAARDRRTPIYLVSAAAQPNFGDELITRTWLDWLSAYAPQREVWLDTIEPGRAAHLFHDAHPRLRVTDTLWQAAHTQPPLDVFAAAARMEELLMHLGSPRNDAGLRHVRGMRSIHLLGGGYLNTIWPQNLAIVAALTHLKRVHGVRIFATGQGLLPHDDQTRSWMREQLAQFDYAEARDPASARTFGIHPGSDDAFLAFAGARRVLAPAESLPAVMVLTQSDMVAPGQAAALEDVVDGFVDAAGGAQRVGFAEALPPDDMRFAWKHLEKGARRMPFLHIWDEGFPAAPGQAWLTSRFHAHLVAAAAGARGVIVNVRPGYYDVKHDALLELGTGWTLWDPEAAGRGPTPQDATGDPSFPALARALGRQKAALARRLYR